MRKHFLFCLLLIAVMLAAAGFAALRMPKQDAGTVLQEPSSPTMTLETTPPHTMIPTTAPTQKPPTEPTQEPTAEPSIPVETALEVTPEPDSTPQPTPEQTQTPQPTTAPYTGYDEIDLSSSAILGETEDMGQEYLDQIIFLGDSTTYGLKAYGVLSDGKNTKQVWTPTSGTLTLSYQSFAAIWYPDEDVEITIREAVQKKQPEMMVITLGVNGVSFMERDDFIAEYTDLVEDIQELSPNTKIIIQSIFPIAASYEYKGSINNEKICRANTWLLEIAEATGVRYLNTISVLMGSDGYMPESYQNGDGLHLNGESFRIVLNYIRTHGYQ